MTVRAPADVAVSICFRENAAWPSSSGMLKTLTDLSADSLKKAVSFASDKMDGVFQSQLRDMQAEEEFLRRQGKDAARLDARSNEGADCLSGQRPHLPPRSERTRIAVDRSSSDSHLILRYQPHVKSLPGVYIAPKSLHPDACDYFEVQLLETGHCCDVTVGLVPCSHSADQLPGRLPGSYGYDAGEGRIYLGHPRGSRVAVPGEPGDRIGCGLRVEKLVSGFHKKQDLKQMNAGSKMQDRSVQAISHVRIFFSLNGHEIASTLIAPLSIIDGLFPAVGLCSPGEMVKLRMDAEVNYSSRSCPDLNHEHRSFHQDLPMSFPLVQNHAESFMSVCRESRFILQGIRLRDSVLKYSGPGKALAQARLPLNTERHYFEVELMDPGMDCHVSIGVATKGFHLKTRPGWDPGSLAFHMDTGRVFAGSVMGQPFGSKCGRGDVVGCGIIFPREYADVTKPTRRKSLNEIKGSLAPETSTSEDSYSDDNTNEAGCVSPVEVTDIDDSEGRDDAGIKVFFCRNGQIFEQRKIGIPDGGFFPTIGMLSRGERVRVDLNPLSG